MSRIRQAHTAPELVVRRVIFALGYRFRLHDRNLPGSPDIVFRSRRKVIFVHGCFWHRHVGCRLTTSPKTRQEFWQEKFRANQARDQKAVAALRALGWETMIIWQCEAKPGTNLVVRIRDFLDA